MKSPLSSARVALLGSMVFLALPEGDLWALQNPRVQVRDSAGVRIVDNPETLDQLGTRWAVEHTPSLEIGSLDGPTPTLFSGIFHGTVLEDGRIVVGNSDPLEVRVFDPKGGHLTTFGGEGEGPGEFSGDIRGIRSLEGDMIAVQNGRWNVHVFSSSGDYIRSLPGPLQASVYAPLTAWVTGTSYLLGNTVREPDTRSPDGVFRLSYDYTVWSGSDSTIAVIGRFPGVEQFRENTADNPLIIPFGRESKTAICAGRIYVGDNQAYGISVYAPNGRLIQMIRKRYRPLSLSAADRAAARRRVLEGPLFDVSLPPAFRESMEKQAESIPIPDTHPAFQELACDRLGLLWVLNPSHVDQDTETWDVFGLDGVLQATVEMPRVPRVLEIGDDFVLAVWRGMFDVEYVRLLGLQRGVPSGS